MSEPFIGQIQPFGFSFAPKGWAQCNGQLLSISQNTALFSLLGTTYGGNGQSTFGLPNLQSRVPVHRGVNVGIAYPIGELAGREMVTLNIGELPAHNHAFAGSNVDGDRARPGEGAALANIGGAKGFYYAPDTTPQPMSPDAVMMTGGNQPHTNIQPYLTINWCIAMVGLFPSRN